jgi:predicted nucleic acid-binding protein
MTTYVLDACALLAVLSNEQGAEVVEKVYERAVSGEVVLAMHKLNLLEVYYRLIQVYGKESADDIYIEITNLPICIYDEISGAIFSEAGRLKAKYKVSLADSVALAQAMVVDGELLTCDHKEFDPLVGSENVKFLWIR